jgi:T3SS negative regulator,GrlR
MKMEGLWRTHFCLGDVQGDGLAVLRDGEVLGGDPARTYTGSYRADGPELYLDVRVSPYAGHVPADMDRPLHFVLWGSVSGDSGNLHGSANNEPNLKVTVDLHRAA